MWGIGMENFRIPLYGDSVGDSNRFFCEHGMGIRIEIGSPANFVL